ncbi:MAG: hypothetical protein QM778_04815 [Myxococcales bacterium]
MPGETESLLTFLRAKHSPFLVARVFLKLGREVPDRFKTAEDDHAMADLIRKTCLALGIKELP